MSADELLRSQRTIAELLARFAEGMAEHQRGLADIDQHAATLVRRLEQIGTPAP